VGISECEAWKLLARAWARARSDAYGTYYVKLRKSRVYGLCRSIKVLRADGVISYRVARQMLRRILNLYPEARDHFVWSRDSEGARARAEFCQKMVKEVAPKGRATGGRKDSARTRRP